MKKNLVNTNSQKLYYFINGKKIFGVHENIIGNVTGITGNVTGISGNVTGITGDIDKCKITDEERKSGINITDLIE